MHLVTSGYFRSRDKDVIVENPMLHANLMTMSCRTGVICRSKFYTALIGIFDLFRSCDLDLDPMTFVYELDPYSLEIYRIDVHELPTSSLLKVLVSPTYRRTHYAFTHTDLSLIHI